MVLLANILGGLAAALDMLLTLLMVLVVGRVIISWVNADPGNPIVRTVVGFTEPFLRPLQRRLPSPGGIDLSPILFFVVLAFINYALVQSLADYGSLLRLEALRGQGG